MVPLLGRDTEDQNRTAAINDNSGGSSSIEGEAQSWLLLSMLLPIFSQSYLHTSNAMHTKKNLLIIRILFFKTHVLAINLLLIFLCYVNDW